MCARARTHRYKLTGRGTNIKKVVHALSLLRSIEGMHVSQMVIAFLKRKIDLIENSLRITLISSLE